MTDSVQIRGLKVEGIVGVHAWEKKLLRTLVFDIELATDAAIAAKSDSIKDAIDYQAVADAVTAFVADSRYNLIETLADRLAAHLMEAFDCPWLRLAVHKPGAVANTQDILVSITRGNRD